MYEKIAESTWFIFHRGDIYSVLVVYESGPYRTGTYIRNYDDCLER
jgi:hypothetical protein